MTGRHRFTLRMRRPQPRAERSRRPDSLVTPDAPVLPRPNERDRDPRLRASCEASSEASREFSTLGAIRGSDGLPGDSSGETVILATMTPGLEETCATELITRVQGASLVATGRGKVWVSVPEIGSNLATIRTADNLFLHLGEVEAGPTRRDLPDLAASIASLPALEPILGGRPEVRGSGFVVNASRRGQHTWSRFEAGSMIADAIATRYPDWPDLTGIIAGGQGAGGRGVRVAVELRADVEGDRATVSWRLTPPLFRFRGPNRGFARASLLPTVAHALTLMSDPHPKDRFLDPFAGSGTIVTERASRAATSVTGLEIERQVAAVARSNSPEGVCLVVGDARAMPLDSGSIDTIVTNLPFGRQVLDDESIPALYTSAAREFARVLANGPQAQVIALTTRVPEAVDAMTTAGFSAEIVATLGLNGQRPSVVKFVRR
jgi:tRNA (guanine6-N2)-methyltransferase